MMRPGRQGLHSGNCTQAVIDIDEPPTNRFECACHYRTARRRSHGPTKLGIEPKIYSPPALIGVVPATIRVSVVDPLLVSCGPRQLPAGRSLSDVLGKPESRHQRDGDQ